MSDCITSKNDIEHVSTLNQMAIRWGMSGRYSDSMKCFEEAFTLLRVPGSQLLRSTSPSAYLQPIDNMQQRMSWSDLTASSTATAPSAAVFDERLDYDEGWNLCSLSSSSISVDHLGPNAPYQEVAAALLYNVGQVLLLQHQQSRAKVVFIEAYIMARSSCTEHTHLLLVPILHRIGYLQYWERDIPSAIATYLLALDICHEFFADQHPERTAATLNCLGVLHFHLQVPDSDASLQYLLMALELQQQHKRADHEGGGGDDAAVATTLNNLGRVYFTSERYGEALDAYKEALRIRRCELGPRSLDVAVRHCRGWAVARKLSSSTKSSLRSPLRSGAQTATWWSLSRASRRCTKTSRTTPKPCLTTTRPCLPGRRFWAFIGMSP
jgi:tetratricopeptide (TPR) repeat protein